MRNPILQLPDSRSADERRKVLRTAIRQLERAQDYVTAVAFMDIPDREARREVQELRHDLEVLRRRFVERRDQVTE
ncbi:MAG TPA: hypothetical protein VHJ99_10330 [Candidatus Dormibacteraeota bacterium]|nr:hypothetical protein [Candidatus Dormibacteraeota bacterium]